MANFFMNARRRSLEKWQDGGDSKNSSMVDSPSPQSTVDPSEGLVGASEDTASIAHLTDTVYGHSTGANYANTDQTSLYAAVSMVSSSQAPSQVYIQQPDYSFAATGGMSQQTFQATQDPSRIHPYMKPAAIGTFQAPYFAHYQQEKPAIKPQPLPQPQPHPQPPTLPLRQMPQQAPPQLQQSSSLFDLRRLASASQLDPRFLATATEFSASHQSLRDQALEICSNMAAAVAAASAKFNAVPATNESQFMKPEADPVGEATNAAYLASER